MNRTMRKICQDTDQRKPVLWQNPYSGIFYVVKIQKTEKKLFNIVLYNNYTLFYKGG